MEGEAAHHLGRVLRAQPGQLYELSDGSSVWLGRIDVVARDRVDFSLLEQLPTPVPELKTDLLLAVVKFEAFEWALEKATELGVTQIVPLAAARSEKNLVSAAVKRSERWRKILLESCQQCRRLSVPQLAEASKPAQAFAAQKGKCCMLLSERPDAPPIRRILSVVHNGAAQAFAVAIGPEGGWTDDELSAARSAGFEETSLGPLILRAETAVLSALSIVNFALSAPSGAPR